MFTLFYRMFTMFYRMLPCFTACLPVLPRVLLVTACYRMLSWLPHVYYYFMFYVI